MSRPSLGESEEAAVAEVLRSGWLGEGPLTRSFESAVAEFTGAPHVIAVNTGTAALHLTLLALGAGPGDEVILPSFTYASDPMAVTLTGATPVFADIDPITLNLAPAQVNALLSPRTRVILPTDYAGLAADVPGIRRAMEGRDIPILRDAAHSFGSRIDGRPVGVWCGETATMFSFDPVKNLTCGEGGAVLVNDDKLAQRLRQLRSLGFAPSARGKSVTGPGYRCHLSSIHAAIGLAQFSRLPELLAGRQAIAREYDEQLRDIPGIVTFLRDYGSVVPFLYPVRIVDGRRDELVRRFQALGIHADLRYSPCHREPYFQQTSRTGALPETERLAAELLCLPIYTGMTEAEQAEVVSVLRA